MGNIRIHSHNPDRYRCRVCKRTFSARRGTMLEGLRTPPALIIIVVTLLAYGCPIQAIVRAYGLDERTVADWQKRAGKHCQQVHHAIVEQGKVDTSHVQADAHSSKRAKTDCLDGPGDRCHEPLMDGRSGQCSSRSSTGRSVTPTGACLLSIQTCFAGLYRRMGSLPQEHHACVSRQSEKDCRQGKSLFRGVAGAVYRHRDQTHGEETGRGGHAQGDVGNA